MSGPLCTVELSPSQKSQGSLCFPVTLLSCFMDMATCTPIVAEMPSIIYDSPYFKKFDVFVRILFKAAALAREQYK